MGKEQFIGAWKLVSSEFRRSDGEVTYLMGKDAVGVLMYDAKGHMAVQSTRIDRPAFASGNHLNSTPAEAEYSFGGFIAYYGTYEVNEGDGTVTHHVEGSSVPSWVGTAQKRFFEFSGNRLTLTMSPMPTDSNQVTGVLIWERAN